MRKTREDGVEPVRAGGRNSILIRPFRPTSQRVPNGAEAPPSSGSESSKPPELPYLSSVHASDSEPGGSHSTEPSSSHSSSWFARMRQSLGRFLPTSVRRRVEALEYEHQRGVLNAALKQVDAYQKVISRSQADKTQAIRNLWSRKQRSRRADGSAEGIEMSTIARVRLQDRTTYD